MKHSSEILQYGLYLYTKDLNINGLSLVVMEVGDNISGIKTSLGKTEKFAMSSEEFMKLIKTDTINFVEIVPKFVRKDFLKIYNSTT